MHLLRGKKAKEKAQRGRSLEVRGYRSDKIQQECTVGGRWGKKSKTIHKKMGEHRKGNVSILPGAGPQFRCCVSIVKSFGRTHIHEDRGVPPLMWKQLLRKSMTPLPKSPDVIAALQACFGSALQGCEDPGDEGWNVIDY